MTLRLTRCSGMLIGVLLMSLFLFNTGAGRTLDEIKAFVEQQKESARQQQQQQETLRGALEEFSEAYKAKVQPKPLISNPLAGLTSLRLENPDSQRDEMVQNLFGNTTKQELETFGKVARQFASRIFNTTNLEGFGMMEYMDRASKFWRQAGVNFNEYSGTEDLPTGREKFQCYIFHAHSEQETSLCIRQKSGAELSPSARSLSYLRL